VSKNRFAGPVIAVVISIAFVAWMMSGSDDAPVIEATDDDSSKSLIPAVQLVTSESRTVQQSLDINGTTEAKRFVTVRSEANGKVIKLLKKDGDTVKKDEIIAQIDTQDIPAKIRQAKAFQTQTRLEYEGAQKLSGQGLQNETQLAAKLANYEQAKAQLASLELQRANTTIKAPFSGQIEKLNLELGSYVRPGDSIADIYDYSQLKFVGSVSEKDIASIEIGQNSTVELINGDLTEAKIAYIGSVANPATRTFIVEMSVNSVNRNVSGVTSVASVPLKETQGHYISPALLYINQEGLMGLKTLNTENRVEFFEVSMIKSDTNGVWIDGLPSSANIIIVGQGFVNVGDEVRPTIVDFDSSVAVGL
jgi:multidrug efflux system membrane fusion protein